MTWCGLHNRFYEIYVLSRREGQEPVIRRLTASDDDAMSPKIATGPDGTVTVAYYRWARMGSVSRDRNIFERTFDPVQRTWSQEREVSPREPQVEDHTDPDVVIDRVGAAWVVWSYDYHPQLYKRPLDAAEPTIFAARVGSNTVSAPFVVGTTGKYRHAIDLFPSAAIDSKGAMWCAWDCSEPTRCIRLARLGQSSGAGAIGSTFGGQEFLCSTPALSAAAGQPAAVLVSARSHGLLAGKGRDDSRRRGFEDYHPGRERGRLLPPGAAGRRRQGLGRLREERAERLTSGASEHYAGTRAGTATEVTRFRCLRRTANAVWSKQRHLQQVA